MTTQKSVYMVFNFFCLNSVAMDFYLIVSSPDERHLSSRCQRYEVACSITLKASRAIGKKITFC